MNYTRIYTSLIEKAKQRSLIGYKERHHIIPKCMGGTNDRDNLVDLTPEEHYLAHQLLVKMHPGNVKLLYAATAMGAMHPTNKLYGWIRRNLSKSLKGRKLSEEHKENIRKGMTGVTHTEASKKKMRQNNTQRGKPLADSTKEKLRISMTTQLVCPHCNLSGGKSAMRRWHFDNCRHSL